MIQIQHQYNKGSQWYVWSNIFTFNSVAQAIDVLGKVFELTPHTDFVYYASCTDSEDLQVYFRFLELDNNELVSIKSPWYLGLGL